MRQLSLDIQRADKNQQFAANLSQLSLELSNFDIDLRNILERRLMSYSGLHLADTMQRFEISYSHLQQRWIDHVYTASSTSVLEDSSASVRAFKNEKA